MKRFKVPEKYKLLAKKLLFILLDLIGIYIYALIATFFIIVFLTILHSYDSRSREPLKIENPEKSAFIQKQFEFSSL